MKEQVKLNQLNIDKMNEVVIFSWVFAFVIIAYVCTKRKSK